MIEQNMTAFTDDYEDRKVSFYKKKLFKQSLKVFEDELSENKKLSFFKRQEILSKKKA